MSVEKLIYQPNTVTPNVYGDSLSLYEHVGKSFVKINELIDIIENMMTTGIQKPLIDALNVMSESGELGQLIQELIIIDGGTF